MAKVKVISIMLVMFILTQFIGLAVLHANPLSLEQEVNGTIQESQNPYVSWIVPSNLENQNSFSMLGSLIFAFIVAILLLLLLQKFKVEFILKLWFFVVVVMALFLIFIALEKMLALNISLGIGASIALGLALILSFLKIYRNSLLIHNFTELLICPGIAIIFVPIFNFWTMIILLVIISGYDLWAVWRSGIMQKMANYQMKSLKILPGFVIPSLSKKDKIKIQKAKSLAKKGKKSKLKEIKVNVTLLGRGDVFFTLLAVGVVMQTFGFIAAMFTIAGATGGLIYLYYRSSLQKKKKAYPAMPFITSGIFIALIINLGLHYLGCF